MSERATDLHPRLVSPATPDDRRSIDRRSVDRSEQRAAATP